MPNIFEKNPSVSAVITTYNRPDYLQQAIASVLAQEYPIQQIIVIDDCSPSSLQPVIDAFSDPRIIFERLPVNKGANHARNRGVELATGDWVAFLDDDDEWLPTKIGAQIAALNSGKTESDWVGALCSYRFLESGKERVWGSTGRVDLESLKRGNPYCGTSGLIAKTARLRALQFDESLPCGQDWDIFVRLAQEGDLIYLQDPLFLYRRGNHDSVTLRARSLKIQDLEPRLASVYKHRAWLGEESFRLRLAHQALAYFPQKQDRIAWILESIRLAGLGATLKVLFSKSSTRLKRSRV